MGSVLGESFSLLYDSTKVLARLPLMRRFVVEVI
jgi:hypothetical protein